MLDADPEEALPVLRTILERYVNSTSPGEQRIAEVVRGLIAELEPESGGADDS